MKILAGPYASGKTTHLLSLIDRARAPVRLIVPSARRMPGAVPLPAFLSELLPRLDTPSDAMLEREIREALASLDLPVLRPISEFAGFRRRLRGSLEEISAPGTSAAEFSSAIARLPYATATQRAVAAIYARVESRLAARGLVLAGRRTRLAAEWIRTNGAPQSAYFFDGFYSLSDAEIDLVEALAESSEVTLTVASDWPGAARTIERFADCTDVETFSGPATPPRIEKFSAASRVQEAAEIAGRISERIALGESARDFGVIVRQPGSYLPVLRSAFSRYGVPASFHFAEPLARQSTSRFCAAVIESLLDGWNLERLHEAVLLPVSGIGGTDEGDRLDFEMRKRIPGRGFEGLSLLEQRFGRYGEWASARRTPREWADTLAALLETPAAETWKRAVADIAALLPERECTLAQVWEEASPAVAATAIRDGDPGEDRVAVVDALEASQWRFRAAYVCGLLEGEFPARPPGDAFFDNATRIELSRLGVPMRSSEEIEVEERALLDVAVSRAERMTLSWPAVTSAGEESLPSFVLGTFSGEVVSAQPLPPTSVGAYRPPSKAGMVEPEAIRRLMGDGKSWRPTEIECFLQCAFQYLGRYTLKLQPPPPGPSERFDARAQGTLAHKILRRVSENPAQDLTAVLDEELHLLAQRDRIPDSHSMLWHRTAMLRVLRLFLDAPPEREGWHREYEWPFEFDVVEGVRIKGRIDRFDSLDRRAFAIDYKYSKSTRLRKSEAVQGGLYLLGLRAAGFTPEGFAYIALREDGETVYYAPEPLMPESRERTIQAVTAIAQGDVAVRPADATLCRFCDFRAACRVSQTVSIASAEGGA